MKVTIGLIIAYSAVAAITTLRGEIVVDPDNYNGSFETGSTSPWAAIPGIIIRFGSAEHGSWYAELEPSAPPGAIILLPISTVDPSLGHFIFSFHVRNHTTSTFSGVRSAIAATRYNTTTVFANLLSSTTSTLSNVDWSFFSYTMQFSELWDPSQGMSLRIGFLGGGSGSQIDIDNVRLKYIPSVHIGHAGFLGNNLQLSLTNTTLGTTNEIACTEDLMPYNWTPIAKFVAQGTHTNWSVAISNNMSKQLYRVRTEY